MKNKIFLGIALGIFSLGFCQFASATPMYTYDGTFVGEYDLYKTSKIYAQDNSSDSNEVSWVNQVLAATFDWQTELTKTNTPSGEGWLQLYSDALRVSIVAGAFAYDFNSEAPEYFYLKTGNVLPGKFGPMFEMLLFENVASLDWAVIQLNDQQFPYGIDQVGKLSHIGEIGGTPVPEPATMLLFGAGLAGLAGFARRKVQ